jgi:TldD protein
MILPHFRGSAVIYNTTADDYFLHEFGIDETLCRKLLSRALSRGGDFADLYFEHTVSNFIGLEDGKVNRLYGNVILGVGVRTVKGDQVGYGFTQELTEESMMSVASTAASLCDASASAISETFTRPALSNYYLVNPDLIEIPAKLKLPVVQRKTGNIRMEPGREA